MTEPLIVAVPSKGRLQEQTLAFFERSGLAIRQARGARDYFGTIDGLQGVEVQFRSASEIAREIGAGNVHLAVTGIDLLHETLGGDDGARVVAEEAPYPAHIVTRLGFAAPTSSWPCRRPGSTCRPWPTSPTLPPAFA